LIIQVLSTQIGLETKSLNVMIDYALEFFDIQVHLTLMAGSDIGLLHWPI